MTISISENKSSAYSKRKVLSKKIHNGASSTTNQVLNAVNQINRHQLITAAAYYRAQRRGFENGNELQDWLEAETEVDNRLLNLVTNQIS